MGRATIRMTSTIVASGAGRPTAAVLMDALAAFPGAAYVTLNIHEATDQRDDTSWRMTAVEDRSA